MQSAKIIKNILSNNVIYRPWPIAVNGEIISGQRFQKPPPCSNACLAISPKENHVTCIHGFDYYRREFDEVEVIIFGTYKNLKEVPRQFRNITKGRFYNRHDIERWCISTKALLSQMKASQAISFTESMRPLHEITKWSNQIFTISNRIINKYRKGDFQENFKQSSSDEKALIKSAHMLQESFDTLSIYFNPASAGFGRKKSTDVYRLIHKIAMILEHAEGAACNKKIQLTGNSYKEYDLFESFKIIPLSIIQNAIKYSSDKYINVNFDENGQNLKIDITSTGLEILPEELDKIFEKGFRGKFSAQQHHEGMGIGLYTSKIVSDANGLLLNVTSQSLGTKLNGIPQSVSTFTITIPRPV